ncbi:MAG: hypothetical protein LBD86_04575 [Spirochaetaceae bacterium]|jgi:hypothetical protein|nr:hypothetical protein [Spirochaetaceae bacterium]
MPKQFRRKIDTSAPAFICTAYPIAALIVILILRLVFPDLSPVENDLDTETRTLDIFNVSKSLTLGLIEFTMFFPAIFMSAQLIPFRRVPPQKNKRYEHFSPEFFKLLRPQLIASVVAAIVYSLLFLLVRPLCFKYQAGIRNESILFEEAREKTILFSNRGEWTEASRFLQVCERIWPGNTELEHMREIVDMGLARIVYDREPVTKNRADDIIGIPGQPVPVNAQSAMRFAEQSFREERYYDAHRLAVIAERLSVPGSNEAAQAVRFAGTVWNAIESLEPDAAELERRTVYLRKREGYEAMNGGNWVSAYYIFRSLVTEAPDDPDVKKFFDLSAEGLVRVAFFVDEMDTRLGVELAGPVFSLPLFEAEGRAVMRLASLSITDDYSYGKGLEIAAFDSEQNTLYRVEAPYAKFLPLDIDGKQFTVVHLQAWGRDYEQMHWDPVWYGALAEDVPKNQLVLAINYEDFLLASGDGENLDGLFMGDIWSIAKRLDLYGYVPEVYYAEIVNSATRLLLFLPLMIFSLIMGWKLRGRRHRSLAVFPMVFALPLVLNGLIQILRGIVNYSGIFAVLSFGFTAALVMAFVAGFVLFMLGIVILAAQRS